MLPINLFSKSLAVLMSAAIPFTASAGELSSLKKESLSERTSLSVKASSAAIAAEKGYITYEDLYITNVIYDNDGNNVEMIEFFNYTSGHGYFSVYCDNYLDERTTQDALAAVTPGTVITITYEPHYYESYCEEDVISRVVSLKIKGVEYVGDVNDDGIVNIFDRIAMQQYLAGKLTQDDINAGNADVNEDGIIDNTDLKELNDYLLGRSKRFNSPGKIGSVRLTPAVTVLSGKGKDADEQFVNAQMKFSTELFKEVAKAEGSGNILISPLSVMTALAMTANGADAQTLEEMENVLGDGMDIETLDKYMVSYLRRLTNKKYKVGKTEKSKLKIADSVWFRDIDALHVKDEFLQKCSDYFGADAYKTAFDDSTKSDINNWVNDGTEGMIKELFGRDYQFSDLIMMCLINTVYFEDTWESKYTDSYPGKFTKEDGSAYTVDYLYSDEFDYYKMDNAQAFRKDYQNGDFSFVGILPDEGIGVYDFVNTLDPETLSKELKVNDLGSAELHVKMPKFKYNYSTDLKEALENMGMPSAFISRVADFSNICEPVDDINTLNISSVIHKTAIELNESGTKAAAVTAVIMDAATAAPREVINLDLDRPYVYMIVDNDTDLPIFMGVITDPTPSSK